MKIVSSQDGTRIAYDVYGNGPVVILVAGTMGSRVFGPSSLAELLAPHFTIIDYDRRGRGDSDDTPPYTPQKEVQDIAALIEDVGGTAALYGASSGAALAAEASISLGLGRVKKLAMYEGPYSNDPTIQNEWQEYGRALREASESGDADEAVMAFLSLVHAEGQAGALRQDNSEWEKLRKLSPTLMYDYRLIGESKQIPRERLAKIQVPTLVMHGQASGPAVASDTELITSLIPGATQRTMEGQAHNVDPQVIAPVLRDFFADMSRV